MDVLTRGLNEVHRYNDETDHAANDLTKDMVESTVRGLEYHRDLRRAEKGMESEGQEPIDSECEVQGEEEEEEDESEISWAQYDLEEDQSDEQHGPEEEV